MAGQRKEDSEVIADERVVLWGESDFRGSKMRIVMVYNSVL